MRYNSIGMKLKLVFMLIMSVLLAIFGALDYWRTQQELRHALDGEVAAVGKRLAANLAGPMWNFDNTQGRRVVEAEMSMAALSGCSCATPTARHSPATAAMPGAHC